MIDRKIEILVLILGAVCIGIFLFVMVMMMFNHMKYSIKITPYTEYSQRINLPPPITESMKDCEDLDSSDLDNYCYRINDGYELEVKE